jgi:hypothetical protein
MRVLLLYLRPKMPTGGYDSFFYDETDYDASTPSLIGYDTVIYDESYYDGVSSSSTGYDFNLYDESYYDYAPLIPNLGGYDNVYYDEVNYDNQVFVAGYTISSAMGVLSTSDRASLSLVSTLAFTPVVSLGPLNASISMGITGTAVPLFQGAASMQLHARHEVVQIEIIRIGATLYPLPLVPVPTS